MVPLLGGDGRLMRVSIACDALDPAEWQAATAAVESAFETTLAPTGATLRVTGSYGLLLGTQAMLLATLGGSHASTAGLMLFVIALSVRSLRSRWRPCP